MMVCPPLLAARLAANMAAAHGLVLRDPPVEIRHTRLSLIFHRRFEADPGHAVCSLPVLPHHLNANNVPMGGAIFTLADFAFAVAANQGRDVVTQASQVTFLKTAQGKRLIAEARQVKDGKRICFYEVKVNDDLGNEVAFVTVNGYVVSG